MIKQMSARRKTTTMERVYRVRLDNLRNIIKTMGGKAALSRAMGCSPSFVTHIAGEAPIRTIGEKLARDVEVKLGLYSGFLDQVH